MVKGVVTARTTADWGGGAATARATSTPGKIAATAHTTATTILGEGTATARAITNWDRARRHRAQRQTGTGRGDIARNGKLGESAATARAARNEIAATTRVTETAKLGEGVATARVTANWEAARLRYAHQRIGKGRGHSTPNSKWEGRPQHARPRYSERAQR